MARAVRAVVQVERLRDQVYELIREDLKSGAFQPGQRLLEIELADRYNVSRTPVREALFQLSRDGLLSGNERGYVMPTYTRKDALDRIEVKRLLDPKISEQVALEIDAKQVKALQKLIEQEKIAHDTGKLPAFIKANHQFRALFREVCGNALLVRCATMVDDQFEIARNRIFESPENRRITLHYDEKLLKQVAKGNGDGARAETEAFIDFLKGYYDSHAPA